MPPLGWALLFMIMVFLGFGFVYLPKYIHKLRMDAREVELKDLEIKKAKANQENEELSGYLSDNEKKDMRKKADRL